MRKPMNIINSDQNYGEFLLSIQQREKDLLEGKTIPIGEVREAMESYYSSIGKQALHGYQKWIHANNVKIAQDIKKVLEHGANAITAPENERKRIEFDNYVKAIKGLCILPSDVDDIVKDRALEVAHAMYPDRQPKKKLKSIKAFLKRNYKALKSEVEKEMAKKNKEISASSSSSATSALVSSSSGEES